MRSSTLQSVFMAILLAASLSLPTQAPRATPSRDKDEALCGTMPDYEEPSFLPSVAHQASEYVQAVQDPKSAWSGDKLAAFEDTLFLVMPALVLAEYRVGWYGEESSDEVRQIRKQLESLFAALVRVLATDPSAVDRLGPTTLSLRERMALATEVHPRDTLRGVRAYHDADLALLGGLEGDGGLAAGSARLLGRSHAMRMRNPAWESSPGDAWASARWNRDRAMLWLDQAEENWQGCSRGLADIHLEKALVDLDYAQLRRDAFGPYANTRGPSSEAGKAWADGVGQSWTEAKEAYTRAARNARRALEDLDASCGGGPSPDLLDQATWVALEATEGLAENALLIEVDPLAYGGSQNQGRWPNDELVEALDWAAGHADDEHRVALTLHDLRVDLARGTLETNDFTDGLQLLLKNSVSATPGSARAAWCEGIHVPNHGLFPEVPPNVINAQLLGRVDALFDCPWHP